VNLQRSQAGFSFVELLFVMLIGVVLYGLMLAPSEETKRKREMAQCAENLRKLHLTLGLYANEHDGAFPAERGARRTADVFRLLTPQYTTDQTFLSCPAKGGGYSYAMGLRKDSGLHVLAADRLATSSLTNGARLFSKEGSHGDSVGNVLFTDGHVESLGATAPRDLSLPPSVTLLNP
jgi:prepilin-type processing-associated H-X9-DG protein